MGACPVRVISFENYSCDTVGMQIKAVNIPDEFEEKPRILILACENDAYPALDMAGIQRLNYSAYVRVDPGALPRLGEHHLDHRRAELRLRRRDDDGLQEGRRLPVPLRQGLGTGHYRMSKIDDTLKQLGLEPERVQTQEVAITDNARVVKLINEYVARTQGNRPLAHEGLRLKRRDR
jgi:quinone-modifying oxidoreductase subunit QmoB